MLTRAFGGQQLEAGKGGEDAFFISTALWGAVGVADGVGSWTTDGVDPSLYSRCGPPSPRNHAFRGAGGIEPLKRGERIQTLHHCAPLLFLFMGTAEEAGVRPAVEILTLSPKKNATRKVIVTAASWLGACWRHARFVGKACLPLQQALQPRGSCELASTSSSPIRCQQLLPIWGCAAPS